MSQIEFGTYHTVNDEMKKVLCIAENVASSRAPILIEGPSGTGKELIAQFIHKNSQRQQGRFVAVNCAALPEGLLESELFGYEKGAFTGAHQAKPGKFELANGGTFVLDEVSELPLALQAKLLRVIQESEVERLGSSQTRKLNVRVVSISNKDLKAQVQQGLFREDLYYRLNVIKLNVPALSQRKDDIRMLAQFFTKVSCVLNDRKEKFLSEEAIEKLLAWNWPGNIRELENTIERAVLLSANTFIAPADIDLPKLELADDDSDLIQPGMTISEVEKRLILSTLIHTNNNRSQAARLLGISIRTLRNKLNLYKGSHL